MENDKSNNPLDSQCSVKIHFSKAEQCTAFISTRKKVIKLLYLIEEEQKDSTIRIDQWFYGFMLELSSNNSLCDNKLTDVVTKIYGLYENSHYKQMTHSQIKRQIMESKGILDHLIEEASK